MTKNEEQDKKNIAELVTEAVAEIYRDAGEVRPSELVDRARPKDSPIHAAFEWNNSKAAHEYRLMEARQWIRRVRITVEEKPEKLYHQPRFSTDADGESTKEPEGCYVPLSVVVRTMSAYQYALNQVRTRLDVFKGDYEELKEAYRAAQADAKQAEELKHVPDFPKADAGFAQIEQALT